MDLGFTDVFADGARQQVAALSLALSTKRMTFEAHVLQMEWSSYVLSLYTIAPTIPPSTKNMYSQSTFHGMALLQTQ